MSETRLAAFKHAIAHRYLIDYEAGRGGMAVVYVAREVRFGRCVAVKVLAPHVASPAAVMAFRREITSTVQLEHPNILPIFDAGEAEGLPFYVMRYVRGGSLRRRLERRGRLGVRETVRVIRQTAAALQHSHEQQILHCDVKPGNILLDGEHVYLTDFGISRAVHAWERTCGCDTENGAGTPSYMSPEQALGEQAIDGRTDLYSLACVAYEMLVGHPPLRAPTHELPNAVPAPIRTAITRALALAPEDRQRSMARFAAALEERGARRGSAAVIDAIQRTVAMLALAPTPRP
jgi:eukaryotic-like serine/threonine-protein kinase